MMQFCIIIDIHLFLIMPGGWGGGSTDTNYRVMGVIRNYAC